MSDELAALDATAQAALVTRRELSARELVDAAIERLERRNPELNAVIHSYLDLARERADAVEPGSAPFAGVPMLMKDIGGAEAGQPNHAGMAALKRAGYREPADSYFTQRVRAAGLISLGRTNTPELAILPVAEPDAYGATRNPFNLAYSAGGSSGGAAAAVAAGIVPVAHASDGGGSIRGPANICGLVGLKPSRGRTSFGPALGERWSGLSSEFMITRSVRDCAALLDAIAGAMPGDPYYAPPPTRSFAEQAADATAALRVGVMRKAPRDGELDPDCRAAVDAMAKTLGELGHHIEEVYPPALDEPEAGLNWFMVVTGNTARALDATAEKIGRELTADDVEPLTWALAEHGRTVTAPTWIAVMEFVHAYGRRLRSFWSEQGFDLLLTPAQAKTAPEIGYISSTPEEPLRAMLRAPSYGTFTLPMHLSGQPAIALPCLQNDAQLPVGIQLVADYDGEGLLLSVAQQLEQARPWAGMRPACFG